VHALAVGGPLEEDAAVGAVLAAFADGGEGVFDLADHVVGSVGGVEGGEAGVGDWLAEEGAGVMVRGWRIGDGAG